MNIGELRRLRLKNDYLSLVEMESGGLFTWEVTKGTPPYVEEYLFHIQIPGYCSPTEQNDRWTVRITLPPEYPRWAPIIQMADQKRIFHPNWWTNGRWDCGYYQLTESLMDMLCRLLHNMAYDPNYTNWRSPSNSEAAWWYRDSVDQGIFPTIRVDEYVRKPELHGFKDLRKI